MTNGEKVLISTIQGTQLPPTLFVKRRPIPVLDKGIAIFFVIAILGLLTKIIGEIIVEALMK